MNQWFEHIEGEMNLSNQAKQYVSEVHCMRECCVRLQSMVVTKLQTLLDNVCIQSEGTMKVEQ
jgi:hypothetical protein